MIFDTLTADYRAAQLHRVRHTLGRVLAADMAPAPGRVVPADDDLVIGAGRVLQLAVLFIDVSGFSARPSWTRDEQHRVLQVLNVFFTEMVRVAVDYGGTVEKNTGDGLMAYFEAAGGVSAVQRAVGAAMTMMATNTSVLGPLLAGAGLDPVPFRAGIDYGPVTVARVGVARAYNANVAIGTTANVAGKMLARAAAGEILLGELAAVALPDAWRPHAQLHGPSGFTYIATGDPYPLYRFEGRWR